MFIEYNKAKDN